MITASGTGPVLCSARPGPAAASTLLSGAFAASVPLSPVRIALVTAAGALPGVGAHLVDVRPDLAHDEVIGAQGRRHRLGARWRPVAAVAALAAATVVLALGISSMRFMLLALAVVDVGVLAWVAVLAHERPPLRAATGIAAVVLMLVVAG